MLRVGCTNRFFRKIVPGLVDCKVRFGIYRLLLSARGYVVIQARCPATAYDNDIFFVYSINGELIARKKVTQQINAIIFDSMQYHIVNIFINPQITAGTDGILRKHCIITMEEDKDADARVAIEALPESLSAITAMAYVTGKS